VRLDGSHEAIAIPAHGFDRVLLVIGIAEGMPHQPDAAWEDPAADIAVGPELREKFPGRNHTVPVLQEIGEHPGSLAFEGHGNPMTGQFSRGSIEAIGAKDVAHGPFSRYWVECQILPRGTRGIIPFESLCVPQCFVL
jgi:hypothetical protein